MSHRPTQALIPRKSTVTDMRASVRPIEYFASVAAALGRMALWPRGVLTALQRAELQRAPLAGTHGETRELPGEQLERPRTRTESIPECGHLHPVNGREHVLPIR